MKDRLREVWAYNADAKGIVRVGGFLPDIYEFRIRKTDREGDSTPFGGMATVDSELDLRLKCLGKNLNEDTGFYNSMPVGTMRQEIHHGSSGPRRGELVCLCGD